MTPTCTILYLVYYTYFTLTCVETCRTERRPPPPSCSCLDPNCTDRPGCVGSRERRNRARSLARHREKTNTVFRPAPSLPPAAPKEAEKATRARRWHIVISFLSFLRITRIKTTNRIAFAYLSTKPFCRHQYVRGTLVKFVLLYRYLSLVANSV